MSLLALIIVGALLLVAGSYVPPPARGVCTFAGALLLAVGLILLALSLLGMVVV